MLAESLLPPAPRADRERYAGPQPVLRRALATDADAVTLARLGRATFTANFGHLYPADDLQAFLDARYAPACVAQTLADPYVAFWLAEVPANASAEAAEVAPENATNSTAPHTTPNTGTPPMHAIGYVKAGRCTLEHPDIPPDGPAGEIMRLYVTAAFQGSGLGARLLEQALAWLQAQAMHPVFLGVWEHNYGAQRFYARYGFHPFGEYRFQVGSQYDRELILCRA